MFFIHLLEGVAIGFLLAMPIGPIGILCVRHTLRSGKRRGFVIGLSGASGDVVYALVAAFGITLVSQFVTGFQSWIRLAGGLLLLIVGVFILGSRPPVQTGQPRPLEHTKTFLSTFLLALTNPMTLFAYATAFSIVRNGQTGSDHMFLTMLVAGVFFGSLTWFSLLMSLASFFRKNISTTGLILVNRIAGSLIMISGFITIWIGIQRLW